MIGLDWWNCVWLAEWCCFVLLKEFFSLTFFVGMTSACGCRLYWRRGGGWRMKAAQLVESKAVNLGKLTAREGYSRFQNGCPKWQMALCNDKWHDAIHTDNRHAVRYGHDGTEARRSYACIYVAVGSICYDVTPFAISHVGNHCEINCTLLYSCLVPRLILLHHVSTFSVIMDTLNTL